jgi:signal peptidase I
MKELLTNKWFKFGIVGGLYLLWVIWLQNFWWLIGLGIIFDIYVTQKVHWAFWKKKNPPNGKQTKVVEWVDAIIFAVIAATFIRLFFIEAYTIPTSSMEKSLLVGDYLFVSKVAYGPKMPNTPVSFPFVHHTMPFSKTTKSYSEVIKNPYRRLAGLGEIKRNDVVVFNFPEGDTVALNIQDQSYYQNVRFMGRNAIWNNPRRFGKIIYRPVDKRENYIKRCVGISGDEIKIVDGQLFVNGDKQNVYDGVQYNYIVTTNGTSINPKALSRIGVSNDDMRYAYDGKAIYNLPLTDEMAKEIKKFKNVISVQRQISAKGQADPFVFPFSKHYRWNVDNFGPLRIPRAGETVALTTSNLPIYERIIDVYEENDLKVEGDKILINGKEAKSYTFKMNYYWMMGDNRHNSADSRMWGFVPEDHVVGKAVFLWLSLDKDKSLFEKIRFNRLFRVIK